MHPIKIDFTSLAPLPCGSYTVRITAVTQRQSRSSPSPYLQWELEVIDAPYEGRKLRLITSLAAQALWKLKKFLETVEYPCEYADLVLNLVSLTGRNLVVEVFEDNYHGYCGNSIAAFHHASWLQPPF